MFDITLPHHKGLDQPDELEFDVPSCSLQLHLPSTTPVVVAVPDQPLSYPIDVKMLAFVSPLPANKLVLIPNTSQVSISKSDGSHGLPSVAFIQGPYKKRQSSPGKQLSPHFID